MTLGKRKNTGGGGDGEVCFGNNLQGGKAYRDNIGRSAEAHVDPDEERMLRLMRALRVKVTIPIFTGKNKDPITFKTKALDYMEATDIPVRDRMNEFRHCLEGKACIWYDEIDWYRHWASLHFDPALDADIDDFINEVRSVARLLDFPDMVVLATLKNMFPTYRIHFLNVQDLVSMYRVLRVMFLRNRNQALPAAHVGATPFSIHQDKSHVVLVTQGVKSKNESDEHDCAHTSDLVETVARFGESVNRLAAMSDGKSRGRQFCPNRTSVCPYRRNPPFKPMVTRHHWNRYNQSGPPFCRNRFYSQPPFRNNNWYRGNQRGYFRNYSRERFSDRRRNFQFDKSPRGRKPRVASRTQDQDHDRCFNCHEFGHFARDCQYQSDDALTVMSLAILHVIVNTRVIPSQTARTTVIDPHTGMVANEIKMSQEQDKRMLVHPSTLPIRTMMS